MVAFISFSIIPIWDPSTQIIPTLGPKSVNIPYIGLFGSLATDWLWVCHTITPWMLNREDLFYEASVAGSVPACLRKEI